MNFEKKHATGKVKPEDVTSKSWNENRKQKGKFVRIYPVDAANKFVLICSVGPLSDLKLLTYLKDKIQKHRIEQNLPTTRG